MQRSIRIRAICAIAAIDMSTTSSSNMSINVANDVVKILESSVGPSEIDIIFRNSDEQLIQISPLVPT